MVFRRFILGKERELEVAWDSPAFNRTDHRRQLISETDRSLDTDDLKAAIKARRSPLRLLLRTGDVFHTTQLEYDGGLRYPKLEKTGAEPGTLDALLTPRS